MRNGTGKPHMLLKLTLRQIRGTFGRFFAVLAIIALGAGFFSGVRITTPVMLRTVDEYYRESGLFDYRALSTVGWGRSEVEQLSDAQGVRSGEGAWQYDVICEGQDGTTGVYKVHSLTQSLNGVTVTEGRMPEGPDECLLDNKNRMGLSVGDTIVFSDENDPDTMENISGTAFTVAGFADSSLYINFERGTTSIGNGTVAGFLYLPAEAFSADAYTEIYVKLDSDEEIYSEVYKQQMDELRSEWEELVQAAADGRYAQLYADAEQELGDARAEYEDEKAEAQQELDDAAAELADGRQELDDAAAELADGRQELDDAAAELADGRRELDDAEAELADGRRRLDEAAAELADGERELNSSRSALQSAGDQLDASAAVLTEGEQALEEAAETLADSRAQLDEAQVQLEAGKAQLDETAAVLEESAALLAANEETLARAEQQLQSTKSGLDEAEAGLAALLAQIEAVRASDEPDPEQLAVMEAQYDAGMEEYQAGLAAWQAALAEYEAGRAAWEQGTAEYEAGKAAWEQAEAEYSRGLEEYLAGEAQYEEGKAAYDQSLAEYEAGKAAYEAGLAEYQAGQAALERGEAEYRSGLQAYRDAQAEYEQGRADYESGLAEYEQGTADYESGLAEYEDALAEYEDGEAEYEDGAAEYADALKTFEEETADAERELREAEEDLAAFEPPETWLLERNTNIGYACFESDSEIVGQIARVLPIFFILVAILVCMTTMTRMVEERRGQIGVLKGLGYARRDIMRTFLAYSGIAAVIGCAAGYAAGVVLFPGVIWYAYQMMYISLPVRFMINWKLAAAVFFVSLASVLGTTWLSCRNELAEPAASLMRPRAPKAGKRVFLERFPGLWRRVKFMHKVSIRNIFRYQKRFFMMVVGISGCTALLLTGFGLKDSIATFVDAQYEDIQVAQAELVIDETDPDALPDDAAAVMDELGASYLLYQQSSRDLLTEDGRVKSVTVIAPADWQHIDEYFRLRTMQGEPVTAPGPGEALISISISERYGLDVGDTIRLRGEDMVSFEAVVTGVFENHVYNYVLVSRETVEQADGSFYANGAYVNFPEDSGVHEAQAALAQCDSVVSASVFSDIRARIASMMSSLNYVVLLIILSAAALAFVVLYDLTNINILERIREIATLKVLGFYRRETSEYVFRENLVLTAGGIAAGLLLGVLLHGFVIDQIVVDLVFFRKEITPLSYVLSVVLTFVFTILVNQVMTVKIEKINMAESLKSVE